MTKATKSAPSSTSESSASDPMIGRTLGDFHIQRRLGRGGMGEVYLAEQRSLKRRVALKILRADLAADPIALKRFQQEAEAVAKANHANIVQVYACEEVEGLAFMALEYVEGRNLRDFIRKKGPLDLLLVLSFMRQIAAALQHAGELGIIHRDIKPENILLTRKGEAKVADFGLSRLLVEEQQPLNLTRNGVTVGTPLYMAPEQIEGKAVDPRTDIYSFGVTCYHMLTGAPPFTGSTAMQVVLAHIRTEPKPLQTLRPEAPKALCALIHKMMAKDPADRFQSCRELLKELSKIRDSISGQTAVVKCDGGREDLLSLDELVEIAPKTRTDLPTICLPPLPARSWHWVALLLVFVALGTGFVVLAGGAALAWRHFSRPESVPTVPPPQPVVKEPESPPNKETQPPSKEPESPPKDKGPSKYPPHFPPFKDKGFDRHHGK